MSVLSPARWIVGFKLLELGSRPVPHGGKIVFAIVFALLVWAYVVSGA